MAIIVYTLYSDVNKKIEKVILATAIFIARQFITITRNIQYGFILIVMQVKRFEIENEHSIMFLFAFDTSRNIAIMFNTKIYSLPADGESRKCVS